MIVSQANILFVKILCFLPFLRNWLKTNPEAKHPRLRISLSHITQNKTHFAGLKLFLRQTKIHDDNTSPMAWGFLR